MEKIGREAKKDFQLENNRLLRELHFDDFEKDKVADLTHPTNRNYLERRPRNVISNVTYENVKIIKIEEKTRF